MGRKKLENDPISISLELGLIEKINNYSAKEGLQKSRFVEKLIMDCAPDFRTMDPLFYGKNRKRKMVGLTLPPACNEKFQAMRLQYGVTKEVLLAALMADYERKLDDFLVAEAMIELKGNGTK